MEKIEYSSTCALFGIPATSISNQLETVYGIHAAICNTVAKWIALFQEGRENLNNDPRSGRPITVHTNANIELLRTIIEEYPNASFDILEEDPSINRFTLSQIIHNSLGLRK